ncbi:OmpH family outer membrane protein [Parvularcula sp. LCG005]|uniref:OmpH family outer membrane protein n=1 Tax=Parvularcula sp. LCG005 TaxID=3078805 RepID=UPI00294258A6|nr:OmpH family outer membrane protein [Parvularcula sp. LCG005]WOI52756.1 OmpH family outer membrane protein [Parvularcula sp. LCG005]
MTKFKTFMAAIIAAVSMAGVSTAAIAQDSVILFIDEGKLLTQSQAGKSISDQVKVLAAEAEAEVKAEGVKVQEEGKKLEASKDSLSKDDFAKRYQALLQRAQQVGQLSQIKQAEVSQAEARALAELNASLQPVVKKILEKKKATVLLERRAVVYADDKRDITDEIIKALDKEIKTVKVQKVDLIAQAQAAQAARNK